jgi:hypothetical protein
MTVSTHQHGVTASATRALLGNCLASLLEQFGAEARDIAQELRGLAHGIYPPLLRANGLADALFARRAPRCCCPW